MPVMRHIKGASDETSLIYSERQALLLPVDGRADRLVRVNDGGTRERDRKQHCRDNRRNRGWPCTMIRRNDSMMPAIGFNTYSACQDAGTTLSGYTTVGANTAKGSTAWQRRRRDSAPGSTEHEGDSNRE